jgi:hypothetical protein
MARLGSDIATFPTAGFFHGAGSIGLDFCSLYVLIRNDRPASWRMPTPKQMEKLAAEAARRPGRSAAAPDAPLPAEYWESVLKDPRADATGAQLRQRRLAEIQRHVLRISCRRCERTVQIQTADAVRLYGGNAVWKDVAQRLLDNTCQQRTGRHEEDGCWPAFETP